MSIDELILGVNIALGNADLSACPAMQCSEGNLGVFVNCLLIAVNNALHGCAAPSPTPGFAHGHTCCECARQAACMDFSWMKDPLPCPFDCVTHTDAECEAGCGPGPQGGPATCVALTACATDADCDDGNGCTADQCTIDGCTHACLCV